MGWMKGNYQAAYVLRKNRPRKNCKNIFLAYLAKSLSTMGWVRRNNQTFTLPRRNPSKKICCFQKSPKTGGKNGLKMALSRGTNFWWLLKPKKTGVKWKNIFQTGCKRDFFVAVSRGTFLYFAKAEQPNFYAIKQKSVKENLLFFRNHKKWVVKTPEKLC